MNQTEQTYGQFVHSKLKDPTAICDYLGTHSDICNAIHLAMGVCGEAIELMISRDLDNTIEELGDVEFYLQGFVNMGWAEQHVSYPGSYNFPPVPQQRVIHNIVEDAGMLLDAVKKISMYQKELSLDKVRETCARIYLGLEHMYVGLNVTRERILQLNKDKLNKRYVGGYSDKAAQDRADKS